MNKKLIGLGIFIALFTATSIAVTSGAKEVSKNPTPANSNNDNNYQNTEDKKVSLSKQYDDKNSKYSIKYPLDWIYDNSESGSVVFSGKKDTPAYFSTVNIQTILSKKSGGEYKNVSDIIADVKSQILKESPQTNFLNSGSYVVTMPGGYKLNGESLTFIYSYQGHIIEQWQIVVPRKDGAVFYTWAYTAPIEQYSDALPIAKAMLESWSIY